VTLIARLDAESVNWLGTSLGGLIGHGARRPAGLAGQEADPERCGSVIAKAALELSSPMYLGKTRAFASVEEAEKYSCGILGAVRIRMSEAQWRFLTEPGCARTREGKWRPHYSTRAIAASIAATLPTEDIELWYCSDAIRLTDIRAARRSVGPAVARERPTRWRVAGRRPKVIEIPGRSRADAAQSRPASRSSAAADRGRHLREPPGAARLRADGTARLRERAAGHG